MSARRFIFAVALALFATGVFAQQPITIPPVHRYSFSNATGALADGAVIADSAGTANATIRGAGATANGTAVRVPGGASASAAYIDLPNGVASGSGTNYPGYSSATYELWVTVNRALSWSRLLDFGSNESGEVTVPGGAFRGIDYLLVTANINSANDVRLERGGADLTGGAIADTVGATVLGQKVHIVVTYDDADGAWKLYKNGALLKSITTLLGPDTLPDVNVWLGRSNWAADSNTDATYDEFRIYDYALTDQQVLGDYQTGPTALSSDLPTVTIAATDASAQMATTDTGTFTVTRTGITTSTLTVNFSPSTGTGQATASRYTLSPTGGAVTILVNQTTATVTLTPTADPAILGTQSVTLNLTASASTYTLGTPPTAAVSLVDSPINAWKIQRFGSLTAAQAPAAADTADPDGDGLKNLVEFATNKNPLLPDSTGPIVAQSGSSLTFTFSRLKNLPGITAGVVWSDQLTTWSSAGVTEQILADDGTTQTIKATVPQGPSGQRFLVLKVTRP